jgi:hypothetical protein
MSKKELRGKTRTTLNVQEITIKRLRRAVPHAKSDDERLNIALAELEKLRGKK